MNQSEIRMYESLAKLSTAQLTSIASQLESDSGRIAKIKFIYRNGKIKSLLQKLWLKKGGDKNEAAGKEIMDDMDLIQEDEMKWPHFTETEIEYLRMIFHGMHEVLEAEEEEASEEVVQRNSSVSVALPVFNRP